MEIDVLWGMVTQETRVAPFRFLQLLADEQRWYLMKELARSDRKVSELTALVGKPQNLVSYHLGTLREAGIVSSRRSAADGRDTYYRLNARTCADLLSEVGPELQPGLRLDVGSPRGGRKRARRPSVLFLCTGNSSRSQMAEAMLEHYAGGAIRARSAGSHPKPLHPHAVRVMAERGIDISARKSKHLDRFRRDTFDRVITLCDKVREICPEFDTTSMSHWSMADPAATRPVAMQPAADALRADEAEYSAFVRTAVELESRLPFLIGELTAVSEGEGNE
jgi:protein-tyrosine-phosphatase/DNA-binding transcriptional ArsR family regulator